jgi:hypothetical protein
MYGAKVSNHFGGIKEGIIGEGVANKVAASFSGADGSVLSFYIDVGEIRKYDIANYKGDIADIITEIASELEVEIENF